MDHRNTNHGFARGREILIISAHASIATQPRESPFHDPASVEEDKAYAFHRAFDNFQYPPTDTSHPVNQLARVTAVDPDQAQTTEAELFGFLQYQTGTVAI